MELKITRQIIVELLAHSRQTAPIEACGYLAQRDGVVEQLYRLTNVDQASDHFTMDPAEQFRASREIRHQGLELRAVYHSHPATLAHPSVEDIRLAADPNLSYIIVSLAEHEQPVRSFTINQGVVEEEPIIIIG